MNRDHHIFNNWRLTYLALIILSGCYILPQWGIDTIISPAWGALVLAGMPLMFEVLYHGFKGECWGSVSFSLAGLVISLSLVYQQQIIMAAAMAILWSCIECLGQFVIARRYY